MFSKTKDPKVKSFKLSKSEMRLRFCEYTKTGHIIVGGGCNKIYVISPDLKQILQTVRLPQMAYQGIYHDGKLFIECKEGISVF